MDTHPHRILLIEDDFVDQMAFKRMVKAEALPYDYRVAGSVAEAGRLLATEHFDIVITDYNLGDGTAFDIFGPVMASGAALIMTTGQGDEAVAVKAMQAGASDYLIKDTERHYLQIVPLTIERAMQRQRTAAALRQSEEKFSKAFHASAIGVLMARTGDGGIIEVNDSFLRTVGYAREAVLGRTVVELGLISPADRERIANTLRELGSVSELEVGLHNQAGEVRTVLTSIVGVMIGAEPCSLSINQDITERKQTEAALRQANAEVAGHLAALELRTAELAASEVMLRTLFDVLPVGVLILDDHQMEADSNPAQARILQTPPRGRLSDPHAQRTFIHPDGTPLLPEEYPSVRVHQEQQPVLNVEMGITTESGSTIWVDISAAPLPVAGLSSVIVTVDLTERKRIEASLREVEEEFSKTFSSTAAGIAITRVADGLIMQVNDSYSRLTGYSRDELVGHLTLTIGLVTPSEREKLISRIREVGRVRDMEISMRHKSGATRTVLTTTEAITLGGEKCMLSILHDITERKEIERALAFERDQLQALMDNIPDTIYFKDLGSRFTRINQAQVRLLGLAGPGQAIGQTDAAFFPQQPAAQAFAEEQQILQSGQPLVDHQEYVPTAGGQPRWMSSTKVPLTDAAGAIYGLVGISHDITERVKTQEDLQRLNQKLANRVSELSLLNALDEHLQACLTVPDTFAVAARILSQLFPGQVGGLFVVEPGQTHVAIAASWGAPANELAAFALDDCWALKLGHLHLLDRAHPVQPCGHLKDSGSTTSACIPLMAVDQALGVLHLHAIADDKSAAFDETVQQLAQVVADSVALTWANLSLRETLRQQALRDPLTDLFNRRFMEESLAREFSRAVRNGQSIGAIMIDVDHFKQINDRYGHPAGDAVLRAIGDLLQASSRVSDIPCRYGGEEFLLILPEASLGVTRQRAEQIRARFYELQFGTGADQFGRLSMSLGVAAYPEHGASMEPVLQAADAALYQAKRDGRDRTVVAAI